MVCHSCAEMAHYDGETYEAKDPPKGMKRWVEPDRP